MSPGEHAAAVPATRGAFEAKEARAVVAMISEELRSPLAAIVSAAKIITEHHASKPELVDRFGGAIVSEGERVIELLDTYLELASIRFGGGDWADRDVEVVAFLAPILARAEEHVRARKVQLVESIAADLPALHVDPERLGQVLTTLIQQAIDRAGSGGSVTVRAERSGDEILFAVDDAARGMRPRAAEGVFEHDVRLGIAREVVRHYDGQIWVENESGFGSTFVFTVPIAPPH